MCRSSREMCRSIENLKIKIINEYVEMQIISNQYLKLFNKRIILDFESRLDHLMMIILKNK